MNIKYFFQTLGILAVAGLLQYANTTALPSSPSKEEVVPQAKEVFLHGEAKEYSYNITVPQFPSLPNSDPINMHFVASAEKEVAEFIANSTSSYQDMKEFNEDGMSSYLTQSVSVANDTSRFTVLLIEGEEYGAGAAHPNHYVGTRMYDKKLHKIVEISDLFSKPGYFERIAEFAQQSFKERAQKGDDTVPPYENLFFEGFAPGKGNYSVFVPEESGITFYFAEYQVAPYVYGMQKVTVPYSVLAPFINQDSALGNMVK